MKPKKNNKNTVKWIYDVVGKDRKWVVMLTFIHIIQSAVSLSLAFALRNAIDSAEKGISKDFVTGVVILIAILLFVIVLNMISRYIDEKARALMEKNFRQRILDVLIKRSYADISAVHSGEWLNRLTSDVAVIVGAVVQIIPGISGLVIRLVGAMVMLVIIVPTTVYIIIPIGLLMMAFSLVFRKRLKEFHKAAQVADGKSRSFIQERIANLAIIKTFTEEDSTVARSGKYMDELVAIRMRRVRFVNLCNTMIQICMRGGYVLGVIVGGYGIINNTMTFGTMTAVLQLVTQAEAPFSQISGYLPRYYAMLASAERLIEIENMPEEKKPLDTPADFKSIGFEDASFSYDKLSGEESAVLQNLSLRINKGEYVAFVGESGCGKSTAFKVLMCLYSLDSGERYLTTVDGKKTVLDVEQRRLFAYVPQGNGLFNGSIREVLTFGDTEKMYSEEKLWKALEIACAEGFVKELPNGLDTILGEQGSGLSEGQEQRLSIARAIISERPVLMLDEATSALDAATEEKLLKNLKSMTDRTVVIITHRPAALSICDKQIFFNRSKA